MIRCLSFVPTTATNASCAKSYPRNATCGKSCSLNASCAKSCPRNATFAKSCPRNDVRRNGSTASSSSSHTSPFGTRITHRGLDHGTGDAKSAAPHVKSLLFPQRDCYLCVERTPEYEAPLFNRNLNEEQRAAVAMATRRDNHRAPYVIFGPPGTGKTSTMVKMIKSLLKVISAFC